MNESNMSALEWARERWANTVRLAATKTGNDREGWLEDGRYWLAIVETLEAHDRLHTSLTRQSEGLARLTKAVSNAAFSPNEASPLQHFGPCGFWKKEQCNCPIAEFTALVSPASPEGER